MGAVYLGEHSLIGRRAAIKVLHRERNSQREHIERFFTEARATSAIEDPGIVQIYDFGITPQGVAYLVMEYLDGESLSARMRRLHLLQPYDAVRITRQIAGSLTAAHSIGIVHRDLKPENLFMVRDGEASAGERPKILDFGIAKLGGDDTRGSNTRTGAVMGTPAYMSPEQCNDTGKIDHRTDIYSLGCVLFHLLTGRPPFNLTGVGEMISAHLKEAPPIPSQVRPHIHAIIDPLVARCLAKRPADRFQSMLELQAACEAVMERLPPEMATLTPSQLPLVARPDAATTLGSSVGQSSLQVRPRKLGVWIGVSAAAVAAGVVLAVVTSSSSHEAVIDTTSTVPAAAPKREPPRLDFQPEPKLEAKPEPKPKPTPATVTQAGSADPGKTVVRAPARTPVKKPTVRKPPGPYDERK